MTKITMKDGRTVCIKIDMNPDNPRTMGDNFGMMYCFHRKYSLGDKHDLSMEDLKEYVERKDVISLPLYLYDHSGITMSTGPFSCPWDSGQVGYICMTREIALNAFGGKILTAKKRKKIIEVLQQEVETYDAYLRHDVYGYVVMSKEGVEEDSYWGFYGSDHVKSGLYYAAGIKKEDILSEEHP